MAQLIISCEMTIDGVIDSTDSWFIGEGEHEVHPTVFGPGVRPFGDGPPLRMELISTTMYRSGVAKLTYRPVRGFSARRSIQVRRDLAGT